MCGVVLARIVLLFAQYVPGQLCSDNSHFFLACFMLFSCMKHDRKNGSMCESPLARNFKHLNSYSYGHTVNRISNDRARCRRPGVLQKPQQQAFSISPNGRQFATLRPPIRAKPSYCEDSRGGAMWLSGASECERSETRGALGFQATSANWLVR